MPDFALLVRVSNEPEKEAIVAKKADDKARWIVETYADALLRLGTSYLGSCADTEDITQDTLLSP